MVLFMPMMFPFFGFFGFLPIVLIGLIVWFALNQRSGSGFFGPGGRPVPPQLSSDGSWWWDGNRWVSVVSPDGQWRWDGTIWQPISLMRSRSATVSCRPNNW